jgi:hypothetical protein
MELNDTNKNYFVIAPFCIYHHIDNSNSIITNRHNNIEQLYCPSISNEFKFYNTFYAISPMVRPIPTSLKLIRVLNSKPYKQHIEYAYDPFNKISNSITFITWAKPVPDTLPLFIWITT